MSETTATVTIRETTPASAGRRFRVEGPDGAIWSYCSAQDLTSVGLPVPPAPIPDPPEGCEHVRVTYGVFMLRNTDGTWGVNRYSWEDVVTKCGPVTPLIPGDPIEAL